jgi:hypothetical protein
VSVTGIPTAPAAGSTVCLTVTGATGPLVAKGGRGITVVSVAQDQNRPATWTVCVVVGLGRGDVHLESGGATKSISLRGR